MFHESPAVTADMAVLPGVLGCSFDKLRTSSPCDVPFRYASEPIPRYRGTVARLHAHLHVLATEIHETSGFAVFPQPIRKRFVSCDRRVNGRWVIFSREEGRFLSCSVAQLYYANARAGHWNLS